VTTPRRRAALRRPALLAALLGAALLTGGATVRAATPAARAEGNVSEAASSVAATPAGGSLSLIRGGLSSPLFVTHAGDERLFVVEKGGRIRILRRIDGTWRVTSKFLDISGRVSNGGEQGLLGLAFHPDYETNGRFYVDYTNRSGDTVIAEYRRRSAGKADPDSRRTVMTIDQPADNHNGGWIGFKGVFLYIATGDGGQGYDPWGNAQNKGVLLGKMLRIDPLDPDGSGPKRYRIPGSNPFVGEPGRDEIWAYGLRNPWRDSFDRLTGDLWMGDVGQDWFEEIDHAGDARGRNFGWDRLEGKHLTRSASPGPLCTSNCKTLPVVDYPHADGNIAVVGGYVSRRSGVPLEGRYIFGDTYSGRIWTMDARGGPRSLLLDTSLFIGSFGEGEDGRIYVVDLGGRVYHLVGT
jgi:glucose/arabinose dehydrogenase